MNKKTLSTAVLAGLTGIAGIVSVSNAVHVNPDGTGQVLIYPYYTTRSDNVTLISVVNTTADAKAVKVRFVEGIYSAETKDFNLYMSPYDVWTATISDDPAGDGARFVTRDNTCTVPRFFDPSTGTSAASADAIFDDLLFNGGGGDVPGPRGLDRTREGYVEMIEMGNMFDTPGPGNFDPFTATIHAGPADANGSPTPLDCDALVDAWTRSPTGNGIWEEEGVANPEQSNMTEPNGGLFGDAVIVDVPGARAQGYSATALDGFYVPTGDQEVSLHERPGNARPSLVNASPFNSSTLLATGNVPVYVQEQGWGSAPEAVSAALQVDNVHNQFDVDPAINGSTEWVLTFPTKRAHVLGVPAIQPFTANVPTAGQLIGANSAGAIEIAQFIFGCEPITVTFFDRNEQVTPTPPVPSPSTEGGNALCTEVNVISFEDAATAGAETNILGSSRGNGIAQVNFDVQALGFTSGWGQLSFNSDNDIDVNDQGIEHSMINPVSGNEHFGLPAIGFAVRAADNTGVNALFGAIVDHAYARRIE